MKIILGTSFFLILIVSISFPHLSWGVCISTDDGMTTKYTVDEDNFVKVKTHSGETTIKVKDIFWLAGGNTTKRIKLKSNVLDMPIRGEIDTKDIIKVMKDDKEIQLPLSNVVFYFDNDNDDERSSAFKNSCVSAVYETSDHLQVHYFEGSGKNHKTMLLPSYWEDKFEISALSSEKKVSSKDGTFKITLNIKQNRDLQGKTIEESNNIGICAYVEVKDEKTGKKFGNYSMPEPLSSLEKARDVKDSFIYDVFIPGNAHGKGEYYIYLCPIDKSTQTGFDQLLSFKNANKIPLLEVHRTKSNVLSVAVEIE